MLDFAYYSTFLPVPSYIVYSDITVPLPFILLTLHLTA